MQDQRKLHLVFIWQVGDSFSPIYHDVYPDVLGVWRCQPKLRREGLWHQTYAKQESSVSAKEKKEKKECRVLVNLTHLSWMTGGWSRHKVVMWLSVRECFGSWVVLHFRQHPLSSLWAPYAISSVKPWEQCSASVFRTAVTSPAVCGFSLSHASCFLDVLLKYCCWFYRSFILTLSRIQ